MTIRIIKVVLTDRSVVYDLHLWQMGMGHPLVISLPAQDQEQAEQAALLIRDAIETVADLHIVQMDMEVRS